MQIILYTYNCTGCGRCAKHCPKKILKMADNGMCRFVNVTDENSCTGCGKCVKLCAAKAIRIGEEHGYYGIRHFKTPGS